MYGVLICSLCELEWPDELPPLWSNHWPKCECGGIGLLRMLLALVS